MRSVPEFALNRRVRLGAAELERLAARLRGHVDMLAGVIGPRHVGQPSSIEAAAAYIEQQLGAGGDSVTRQEYAVGEATVANLVVERPGTERTDEIVVLGAHYDTVPETPGADDNASAVAMLIEVAQLLQRVRTRRTLRFVAFPCEEPPHFYTETMGSQHYARTCRASGDQIVGMLCLEMVGYFDTAPGSQHLPEWAPRLMRWLVPKRGDFLAAVGNFKSLRLLHAFRRGFKRSTKLPLIARALPDRITDIWLSDNSSFWNQGYPALMITDTSFLRNPHYHLPSDTPDTLDYERLAAGTVGVAGALARLAQS